MFHLFGGRISRVLAQTASKEASKEAPFKASIRGASAIGYRPLELLKSEAKSHSSSNMPTLSIDLVWDKHV